MTDEMPMRAPRNILWNFEGGHFSGALFDDEIVDGDEAGGGEAEFGEHQVDAIHPEGEFVFEFGEVGLLEGGAITDDEGALAFMCVLERGETTDALAPPRMQVRGRQLRDAAKRVVGVFDGLEEGGWDEGGEGLFHWGEERRRRKDRCSKLNSFNWAERQKAGYDTRNRMKKFLTKSLLKNHKPVSSSNQLP